MKRKRFSIIGVWLINYAKKGNKFKERKYPIQKWCPHLSESCHTLHIKVTKKLNLRKEESQDNKQIKTKKRNIPGSEAERESTHVGPIFEMVISQHHAI